jgi:hypothetical protein
MIRYGHHTYFVSALVILQLTLHQFKTMDLIAGFVIINFILLRTVYSSTCEPFQISKDNLNKALIGHSVREINDINHQQCARACMSMSVCKSIDYDRPENTCKLNDADRSSVDPLEFEIKVGSIFSDISEWPSVST